MLEVRSSKPECQTLSISTELPNRSLVISTQRPDHLLSVSAEFYYEWEASEPKLRPLKVAQWTRTKGWDTESWILERRVEQYLVTPPAPPPEIESWELDSFNIIYHTKGSTGWRSKIVGWEPALNGATARRHFDAWTAALDKLTAEEDNKNIPLADRVKLVTIELQFQHIGCDRYSAFSDQITNAFKYRLFEVYPRLPYPKILKGLGKQGRCNKLAAWLNARKNEGVLLRKNGPSGKIKDSVWSVVSPETWAAYIEQHGMRPYTEEQKQTVRDRAQKLAEATNPKP